MKLKLEAVRDISILVAEGPITPENFAVLKAGIKKLFKDGKNKIILELPDSGTFTPTILRELATLNLLASELSGSIILAQIAPLTRAKIEAFAKPPAVRSFADRATAVEYFYPKNEEIPKAAEAAPTPPAQTAPQKTAPAAAATPVVPAETSAAGADAEEKAKKFKADIRGNELGDLGTVRKKLSDAEAENDVLKQRLAEIVVTRRDPPDLDTWKEKVALLEKQVADLVKAAQEAADPKKGSKSP
jgi:hypothetical protein